MPFLSNHVTLYMSNHLYMQTNITHGLEFLNSCVPLWKSVGLQLSHLITIWSCLRYPSASHIAINVFAQPVILKPLYFIFYEFWKYLFNHTMYNNKIIYIVVGSFQTWMISTCLTSNQEDCLWYILRHNTGFI